MRVSKQKLRLSQNGYGSPGVVLSIVSHPCFQEKREERREKREGRIEKREERREAREERREKKDERIEKRYEIKEKSE